MMCAFAGLLFLTFTLIFIPVHQSVSVLRQVSDDSAAVGSVNSQDLPLVTVITIVELIAYLAGLVLVPISRVGLAGIVPGVPKGAFISISELTNG